MTRASGAGGRAPGAGCWVLGAALVLTPAAAFAQQTHLVVVTGVEGDPEYTTAFHKWASALVDAAKADDAQADVVYLADKPDTDAKRITGRSTKEGIQKALADLAGRVQPNDQVFIVLFGHGSYDGNEAAFNLPGPDLTAEDWAQELKRFGEQRVALVDTTASSGAFLEPLAGQGRAIVTATRTGGERNETIFPEYFAQAFTAEGADKDRDGRVSLSEAFDYAKGRVEEDYGRKGTLQTEHATLQDGADGQLATAMFLIGDHARTAAIEAVTDPELRKLLEQQKALEDKVAGLRLLKSSMPEDQYDRQLEDLLTQLALTTREVQQRQK
jgi:hypothetical protein